MRSLMSRLIGAGTLSAAIVLTASSAGAQGRGPKRTGLDGQLRFDVLGQHLGSLPGVDDIELAGGTSGKVRTGQPSTMVGFGMGVDLVLNDRIVIPAVTLETTFAVGRYATVYATSGQHVAELRPWSAYQVNVMFFGYGMRWKHRRWMGGFMVQPGASLVFLDAHRSDEEDNRRLVGVHGLIRATAEVCRRLDPEQRLCLFGGPNVALDGWFNGGVAGLRVEYGR